MKIPISIVKVWQVASVSFLFGGKESTAAFVSEREPCPSATLPDRRRQTERER